MFYRQQTRLGLDAPGPLVPENCRVQDLCTTRKVLPTETAAPFRVLSTKSAARRPTQSSRAGTNQAAWPGT
jgi:hypothetical protein